MELFQSGKVLKTSFGTDVTIIKHIGGGGQGEVYMVDYAGKKRALKWYHTGALRDPEAFQKNLIHNVEKGSPSPAFLWPLAVMAEYEGSFGYVMELRPEGYEDFTKFLASENCNFASFNVAVEACLQIVTAFRILHNLGYSYQDLNDGNFFINPKTGNVLICDNDNVAPNGVSTGILGKPRYMAPEIVKGRGRVLPNTQSDRYSLATIVFMILTFNHPLEGKRWLVPCLTDEIAEQLYGFRPLFIFDPTDSGNRPDPDVQPGVNEVWKCFPSYMKEMFTKAFSQDALTHPERRSREFDWLSVLARFRSDIIRCSCGNDVFVQNSSTTPCDACASPISVRHNLVLPQYSSSALSGTRIYRCQLGTCDADKALDPVFIVLSKADNPNVLGLKNMTKLVLSATTPSGQQKPVQPGDIVPFVNGLSIRAYDKDIKMKVL